MRIVSLLPAALVSLSAVLLVSCEDPAGVVDPGLQLVWIAPPPETLREGDSAHVAAQVADRNGAVVFDFEGGSITVRFAATGDSQPATACGEACTATVTDGEAALTVGWISAGSWTATACLDRPDGADDLCAERALTVEPVLPVLVVFPVDSVGRRERFAVEARLRLPDGTPVTDLAPPVRLRFAPDGAGAAVRCPEAGPLCQRAPVGGIVRLDSVHVLDTAATALEACAVAPNGDERCDPAGPRAFRVVVPRATLRFVTQPSDAVAGIPFSTQPAVEIVEPDGTRRTDFSDSVFIELQGDGARWMLFGDVPGVGTVRDRVPTVATLGLATFSGARVNRAGAYRLVAEAPGAVPGTSADFTVGLDPSRLQLVQYQGDDQTAPPGTVLPVVPTVVVTGPANDPIAGIPVRFTVQGGGGTVEAEWDTTDLDGRARPGSWTLGAAGGPQSLAAAADGFPTVVFDAVAEAVLFEQLAFITPPPATLVAGDTMPPVVIELRDAQGRRVVGGTDSVRVSVSGDNFGGAVRAAADGRVTFDNITVTRADPLELLVWDPRYALLEPAGKLIRAAFTVTPRIQSPVLTFVSGGAEATANTALDPVPTVSLTDVYGNPLPGRMVTFTATLGNGVVIDPVQQTAPSGGASPGAWILGAFAGPNALMASAEGLQVTHFATGLEPTFNLNGISAGGDFTCGPALGADQPYCWGANVRSQLGEGTQTTRSRPTQLAGALLPMTQMTAGHDFACGIAQENGAAYCWGNNLYGALGIGGPDLNVHATPEAVHGNHVFQQISAGFYHVCGLDTGGVIWCWGDGSNGQLGVGVDRTGQYEPLQIITTVRFTQIDVGALHSCALADTGDVWCWGSNDYGQVGANDSLTAIYWSPVRVAGGRVFTEISAGGSTTCGISEGSVYCWGRNTEGQAGRGSTDSRWILAPAPALGILGTARHVTVGTRHACATNGVDVTYCWGDNNHGQLGDGTATPRPSAVEVTGVNRFVAIDAGLEHTCGLQDGGGAYCWGYNASGRLGLGFISNTNVTAPTQVVRP